MNNVALKTALSALLVSIPLAGAFADNSEGPSVVPQAQAVDGTVDYTTTSSIGAGSASYSKLLDGQLRAAENRINAQNRFGYVNPVGEAQARSEILSIRQANGGALSESAYQTLSGQVRVLNQNIQTLVNGG